jgi:small subunit ribosomal protein S6
MVLVNNQEVKKGWHACKQAVSGMFAKHGAEIVSAKLFGERRLAFPIGDQQRGTYLLVYFNAEGRVTAGLRRELELNETVLRYVLLQCDAVPEQAFEPEAEFDVSKIGEAPAEPEPEPEPEAEAATSGDEVEEAKGTKEEKAGDAPAEEKAEDKA